VSLRSITPADSRIRRRVLRQAFLRVRVLGRKSLSAFARAAISRNGHRCVPVSPP
jgi:hypothetical protein